MYTSPSSSKRILITGATGFIGRYLVEIARERGLEVWIAIRPSSNRQRALELGAKIIELDYFDVEQMHRAISAIELPTDEPVWHYVIHNAGLTKAVASREFVEANAEHTRRFAEVLQALGQGRRPEHFILMSSLSVYGVPDAERGVIYSEQPKRQPMSAYGKSKLLAEQYLADSGLTYSIIQPTGVYGPGDLDYLMALASIQKGINFMAGCSPQKLTFVYGEDVARATLHILGKSETFGRQFIVSDGDEWLDEDFTKLAKELLGVRRVLNLRMPLPLLWLICKAGDLLAWVIGKVTPLNSDKYVLMAQRSWLCDIEPLRQLGWQPRYKLREGLEKTIAWARAQALLR